MHNYFSYGIWAENSDEEEDLNARPTFGGARKKGGRADYSAPVGFVSAGLQKSAKEIQEEKEKKLNGNPWPVQIL